ncbi:hypothetical protein ACFL1T_05030, partial [Chlamydiota bacterium]
KNYFFSKRLVFIFIIFTGLLFLLTFAAFSIPQKMLNEIIAAQDLPEEQLRELKSAVFDVQNHPNPVIRYIFSIPLINLLIFSISLLFLPFNIFMLGYNSISADVYQKRIQYSLLRVTRFCFYCGKCVALYMCVFVILIFSHLLVLLYMKSKFGSTDFEIIFRYMTIFLFYLSVYGLTYTTFIVFLSSSINRPGLVLLIVFLFPIIAGFLRIFRLGFLLPSHYVKHLFSPYSHDILKAISVFLLFSALFFMGGLFIFKRKNLV